MKKEKVLVVGLGEVGRAMFELLKESRHFEVYGVDTDTAKMKAAGQKQNDLPSKVDVMHICLSCGEQREFVDIVNDYVKRFKPKLTIINSTVPPGTTTKVYEVCHCNIVHSPIRGVHEDLEHMMWELKRWTKYVGGIGAESAEAASNHFRKLKLKTKTMKSSLETELAKLFETTYRAWMIVCFQEMHRISRHFNADFVQTIDFLEDTHKERLDRPLMYPGPIGGHCLIPNVALLQGKYDSEFLKLILESNRKRKNEIKDEKVRVEAENAKRKAETLQQELMKAWKRSYSNIH